MTAKLFRNVGAQIFVRIGALLLVGTFFPQNIFSQTNVTYRTPNRWLLIVETTRAMQPRAEAVAQTAGNLLLSGMNGQMRPGDSLGVWTYNSNLHAGEFPLQTWTPESAKNLAPNVALFITRQKFEGHPGRDRVFPAMNQVISNSEFITVILITSGGETVTGTPFDKAINTIHKQWQSQQEKAHLPFVTMLRAQHGRIIDFEVGRPPAALEFPPLPMELQITNPVVAAPPPSKPAIEVPTPFVPNLIVHGKKPEPVAEIISNPSPIILMTNVPVVAEIKTNPPMVAAISPTTNAIAANTNRAISVSKTNQPAITAATEPSANRKGLWIAGLILAAAGGLVWMFLRRSHSQPHVSLITRSLDRDEK